MKYYLFDFDGTLCNTEEGVIKSVLYAMDKMNVVNPLPPDKMPSEFVGPPLTLSFPKYFGKDEANVLKAIDYFRERYNTIGVFENKLFVGIPEMLKELKARGRIMYIASSKPKNFIHMILKEYEIEDYFDGVFAPALDEEKTSKYAVIKLALEKVYASDDAPEFYMVGDRKFDVIGAHTAEIPCIGVKWGSAAEGELEEHGADYVVDSIDELLDLDLKLWSGSDTEH